MMHERISPTVISSINNFGMPARVLHHCFASGVLFFSASTNQEAGQLGIFCFFVIAAADLAASPFCRER
jgi:hypothetical protein